MLRAAAKNHAHVIPVCRPADYDAVLEELRAEGDVSPRARRELAARAFATTAAYDSGGRRLARAASGSPRPLVPVFDRALDLSYGENPHQEAVYYARARRPHAPARARRAAAREAALVQQPQRPLGGAAARARARRPGVRDREAREPVRRGGRDTIEEAYAKALAADPVSAFGGVVVLNGPVSAALGERLAEQFVEVLFAPGYDAVGDRGARAEAGVRILVDRSGARSTPSEWDMKRVLGGMLVQERDGEPDPLDEMDVVCGELDGGHVGRPPLRLDGREAHALERDRDRPRRADARGRRRADEPRRRRADRASRRRASTGTRSRARCSPPTRSSRSPTGLRSPSRPGVARDHPARRLEARRRGLAAVRGGGRGDGLRRPPALPALGFQRDPAERDRALGSLGRACGSREGTSLSSTGGPSPGSGRRRGRAR